MTARDRSRVSTRLYWAALTDAITHQEGVMESHDRNWFGSGGHCKPEERCGAYEVAERQLRRYRAAKAAFSRERQPKPPAAVASARAAPWGYCPECQRRIAGARVGPSHVTLRTHGRFSEDCAGSGQTVDRGTA